MAKILLILDQKSVGFGSKNWARVFSPPNFDLIGVGVSKFFKF